MCAANTFRVVSRVLEHNSKQPPTVFFPRDEGTVHLAKNPKVTSVSAETWVMGNVSAIPSKQQKQDFFFFPLKELTDLNTKHQKRKKQRCRKVFYRGTGCPASIPDPWSAAHPPPTHPVLIWVSGPALGPGNWLTHQQSLYRVNLCHHLSLSSRPSAETWVFGLCISLARCPCGYAEGSSIVVVLGAVKYRGALAG